MTALRLVPFIFAVGLTACSSSKPSISDADYAGQVRDSFTTETRTGGLKLFTYKVWRTTPLVGKSELPHQKRLDAKMKSRSELIREQRARERRIAQWEAAVEYGLKHTLEQSRYCKEGYIELDRTVLDNEVMIRGECRDGEE
ncbi:hypothetical protein [Parashewanella tropica]|uniref:hypothetical protein n=1 Tax=Parashewanella tropica TaxID=2547970 RepID=UPI00105A9A13|nr:hypothetical protein [Parashewanella tropica]